MYHALTLLVISSVIVFWLDWSRVTYLRLDGSVEPEKRFDIVKAFNSDPTIDALLLTTHGIVHHFNAKGSVT